ncbi:acyl-CoA dehydrogenase family protein [Corynebacterium doosanense]|uniref:Acyl-CoA dehydrogenase n=1 Tax=Corynebacterium doosanense CAU 212 = DSM 45436 TaxID=558173 RepID=A0A097IHU0_9CORY|nr:acyl-CoA dehydrogenase family protein [Corynebacterium doosanense]AIT61686.1 acyl-CoA dehydrogenase [Corynebacterium doosanense CAU 212 = DSM 45436]
MTAEQLLTDDLLQRIRGRAAGYDERNEFFTEDLAELRDAGYLRMLVPEEFGGLGFSLQEVSRAQRRLAQAAPATALGINMHHVIVAVAYTMWLRGTDSLNWVFDAVVKGEIFAFGISEAGNDAVLFDSASTATPDGDGYRISGTKIFTSLSPVWDKLLVHARTPDDQLVFGFLERGAEGIDVKDDWDTLGMRASQSNTTKLDEVVLRPEHIGTHTPIGPNPDPLVFGIFGPFELLLASVYAGIGERAVALAAEITTSRMSRVKQAPYSLDPDIRWQIASAGILMDQAVLQIEKLTEDVDRLGEIDHGGKWFLYFSNVKNAATEAAKDAVELAIRTCGGAQYFRSSELQRLYRDVLAGLYQPSDNESLHSAYAKALLGAVE